MQAYIDQLIQQGYFAGTPKEVVYAIAMVLAAFIVLSAFVAPLAGVTSWLERRVWARMQSRIGPNRGGPQWILQLLPYLMTNIPTAELIPPRSAKAPISLASYARLVGTL